MGLTFDELKTGISEIISEVIFFKYSVRILKEDIYNLIGISRDFKNGDFSIPLFIISKNLKTNPSELSTFLAGSLTEKYINNLKNNSDGNKFLYYLNSIEKIVSAGPYLNFYINKKIVLKDLLISEDYNPFHKTNYKDKTVVIDYSSCNIAKPYGIGHIMSTAIGESLKRCYEYLGYNAVGINYIGDWGTQFGKVLLAYELWGNEKELEERGVYYLYELYVKIHSEEEKDESLLEKAKLIFQKLEDKDPHYYNLWEKIREISLDNFNKYYKLFGNTFTLTEGESKYSKKNIEDIIRILELNQILQDSEGAKVVFLDDIYKDEKIPPCIIKKSDGTTTYALRDIAAVLDRWQRFHFDEALYVINISQQLHIKQFKGVLKKLKFSFSDSINHVAFGTMTFSGQKMQTRKGTILFLQDIYDEVYTRALEITKEKNVAENSEDTATKLAIGAIIFSILKNQRIKDIDFDFNKVLSFEGDTAAYLQYTSVRINSILKKASINSNELKDKIKKLFNSDISKDYNQSKDLNKNNDESKFLVNLFYEKCLERLDSDMEEKEIKSSEIVDRIIFELYLFDEVIKDVTKEKEPYLLSRYLLKLAMLFNQFYAKIRVLEGDENQVLLKLVFIDIIRDKIEKGLKLLGIDIPQSL